MDPDENLNGRRVISFKPAKRTLKISTNIAEALAKDGLATCYGLVCQAEYVGEIELCSDCGIQLKSF